MVILSNFSERLDELLFEQGMNAHHFAKEMGYYPSSVGKYLKGERLPSVKIAVEIADRFSVSVDYLLGLEEENTRTAFYPCPPFGERMETLLKEFGYTKYSFVKKSGINENCLYDWLSGKHTPSLESVVTIAQFFNRSVDFVLGRTTE